MGVTVTALPAPCSHATWVVDEWVCPIPTCTERSHGRQSTAAPSNGNGHGHARIGGEKVDQIKARLLTTDELRQLPPPTWLLEGILPRPGVAMVYGAPGSYKTFLTLSWALSVSSGAPWEADGGYPVDHGPVIYVAAEGAHGLPARIDAWEEFHGQAAGDIRWHPEPVNLLEPAAVDRLRQAIEVHAPKLIVFDTLARCTVGGDENSAGDMGRAVDALGRLAVALQCAVVVVHHTRKDGGEYRGSSALLGAVDTAVEISSSGTTVTVRCEKQKDAERFPNVELSAHQMGESCVLRHVAQTTSGLARADDLLALLCHMSAIEAVTGPKLRDAAATELEMPGRTFYRLLNVLVAKGFAQNIGTDKRALLKITALGLATVSASSAT